jgi:3-keto-5-aminohexanoate cleavage enzyme
MSQTIPSREPIHPLIINLAPTGMIPGSQQSPHVPLTPERIAKDVLDCAALGASMAHIHARLPDETPTESPAIYADIISRIRRKAPQLILTVSTSGRLQPDVERRAAPLLLEGPAKPDMASLTLGSLNFASAASTNSPQTIIRLAQIMQERGIKPELEVFDVGMVNFAKILIDKGLITAPYYFNILLGNPSTAQVNLHHLSAIIADLPAGSIWSLAGIGRFQHQANALGMVMGHGVRVGLEDNLWLDQERTQLATNVGLVARIRLQATALERTIATPQQVRTLLGLGQAA